MSIVRKIEDATKTPPRKVARHKKQVEAYREFSDAMKRGGVQPHRKGYTIPLEERIFHSRER